MMGRQERGQEQLFYEFNLEAVVPRDHLVRRIDVVLKGSWQDTSRDRHLWPL